jgi:CRP-like cAMP-binding protein
VLREVSGGASVLAELEAGEYFGEMALLNKTARNATVRCVEAMDVQSLPKREFGLLAGNLPELRRSFESVMERRSRAATFAK